MTSTDPNQQNCMITYFHYIICVIIAHTGFTITLEEDCNDTCMNNCSDGWIQFEDKCYKWSNEQKTWEDAERSCRYIVEINHLRMDVAPWCYKWDGIGMGLDISAWGEVAPYSYMVLINMQQQQ